MIYIKLHPRVCVWLEGASAYGIIPTTNAKNTAKALLNNPDSRLIIEKPYVSTSININKTLLLRDIAIILDWERDCEFISITTARKNKMYTKDQQITEAQTIIRNHNLSPIELLCIHDCLVLKDYYESR